MEKKLKLGDEFWATQITEGFFTLYDVIVDSDGIKWAIGIDAGGVPWAISENDVDDCSVGVFLPKKGRK